MERRMVTVVLGGLWLCSVKFMMHSPSKRNTVMGMVCGVKDVGSLEPGGTHMMIPAMYVSPGCSCLAA